MNRICALAIIFLCICLTAAASAEVTKGSKQFVFTWTSLTNQGQSALARFRTEYFGIGYSHYRGGIAMRYFTSETMAIRPWFWIGYDGPTISTDVEGVEDGKGSDTEWGVGIFLEKYLTPIQSAAPYLGLGIVYNAGTMKYEGPDMWFSSMETIEPKWTSSELHITGTGGFNWFASEWIGVGGEVEVGYIRFKIEEEFPAAAKMEYTGNTFGFLGATMFISIGFGQ